VQHRRRAPRWTTRPARGDQGPEAQGFTLAETLVALGISVTLLATLVPVCFRAVASALSAHQQSMATMLAAARLEQLRGLAFGYEDAGAAGLLRVTDTTTNMASGTLAGGGTGLSPSPPGALLHDTEGFVDYLDAAGRWAGTSMPAAGGAAYVRRWAVTPVPAALEDALVLQVLVAPLGQENRGGPRTDATRRPGDVWLTLVRARVR
jgi:type II secretory pathway pseudopilin PulG